MVVILKPEVKYGEANEIRRNIMERYSEISDIKIVPGEEVVTLQIMGGAERSIDPLDIEGIEGVDRYIPVLEPYRLASRKYHPSNTIVKVGNLEIGNEFVVMAGPCSVDDTIEENAKHLVDAGVKIIRGGAVKPRGSPYSWQGMGEPGYEKLAKAGQLVNLPVISEITDKTMVEMVSNYVDIFQVGARHMENVPLLLELAKTDKPVLLKNKDSATAEQWLLHAEYLLAGKGNKNGEYEGGNPNVILCHRGDVSFDRPEFRNTFDVAKITYAKQNSHLPVCGDPSHGTGKRCRVVPLGLSAIAAGADSLLVEAHYDPSIAKTDGAQTIDMKELSYLVRKGEEIYNSIHGPI